MLCYPPAVDIASRIATRRVAFRNLHQQGCFVIPNPWDVGSAILLKSLGFPAIASTSAGLAFAQGLPDSTWALPLESVLAHLTQLSDEVDLPLNADFEHGYAHDPEALAQNVKRCVATGVAGLSIEDNTSETETPLYPIDVAVERIKAARVAIDETGADVLLTGRAECYLVGHPEPLKESIRRLVAYADAGADVLYAPGPRTVDEIKAIVQAVHPKPVNVLMGMNVGFTVQSLADLGVRRISTGSSLARAAWTGFLGAAKGIAEQGTFEGFEGITTYAELNSLFRECGAGN